MRRIVISLLILFSLPIVLITPAEAQDGFGQLIPAGGNSYLVNPGTVVKKGEEKWESADQKLLFYFHSDRPGKADLSVRAEVPAGKSGIRVSGCGKNFNLVVTGMESQSILIGTFQLEAGYNKIEFTGINREGSEFARISGLEVRPAGPGMTLGFVKDNVDNRFYWGRRGPSVHLNYEVPKEAEVQCLYTEVTVPVGEDPEGSYFMANGFGEGYFGIQVNGPGERRVLFSVWSPFKTDHPGEIPESDKIVLLKKGTLVHTGEFGHEGSGGQSFFHYYWKAGITYRFLLSGTPDGKGNTVYTAWFFAPEEGRWQLIASFRRPKTDHYLTRLHSFLENFNDRNGYIGRKALYANQWCRDKSGQWFPVSKARFTGDDIARRGYRLDFSGGVENGGFFLQNGGFLNSRTSVNTVFTLPARPAAPPVIDFEELNRELSQ